MDENDKMNQEEQDVLAGQMSYDEVLVYQEDTEQKQENFVISGQMELFEAMQENNKENTEKKELKMSEKFEDKIAEDEVEEILEQKKSTTKSKSKKSKVTEGGKGETTIFRSLDEVMHDSMIPYTEHVVLDRALPRVEDGLKPVQRRILYSMLELGLMPDKPYRKSARIVGDCMGKYHPHGDSSVYDAMVRMSQDFSLREPLVKGHGNFGSIDGDSAAAMRYTEAKLTPLAMELLKDLEKDTVKWSYNFDDTIKEPDMLPGAFPNLLVNGASGIAVGVATNIPPHNLAEVIDGTVAYINDNKINLEEMMKIIIAPDFPTGGVIIASEELKQAYETGKGKIILRAKVEVENQGDKKQLVITELPYQVNKASLLQKIAELKNEQKDKLSAITEIRDESDRTGMRAVIKLKKEANETAILEYLYKATQLQVTFGINMVAIAEGRPKQLGLLEIIKYYVEYQREVLIRKTKFDLTVAKERAHIVEGLLIAIANIDEVIKIIKKSATVAIAKQALRDRFNLSEKQAQAILDMRLARLVNLEIVRLQEELKELKEKIEKLEEILASKRLQYSEVKKSLLDIKKAYKNPRRSTLKTVEDIAEASKFTEDVEVAFAREVMVALTAAGTIKQIPIKNYSLSQKELTTSSTLFDVHTKLYKTMTSQNLLLLTNKGNAAKVLCSSIPEAKWRDKGVTLADMVKGADLDEKVIAVFELPEQIVDEKLYVYTKQGYVKGATLADIIIAKNFYSFTKLKDNDEVIEIEKDNENKTMLFVTKNGNALQFEKTDVPFQGRNASGVMGINLDSDDCVLSANLNSVKGAITLITDNGYAKKMPIGELNVMTRYRKGQRVANFVETGKCLIYAQYSEVASNVVLAKGDKLVMVGARSISYDSRTSKGKQVAKGKLTSAYTYEI